MPQGSDQQAGFAQRLAATTAFQQGLACHRQGRLAEAQRHYEDALRLQPDNFNALYMLGLVAFQNRLPERGVELTTRAIAVNPGVAEAHNNLANGLIELGRPGDALASYDRAIALKPNYLEAHNNRGAALNQLGRYEEALASCDKALAARPDYAEAHYNRGIALRSLQRAADAVASYERAIALKPDYFEAHNNRGIALEDLDRNEEAVASYERAIALRVDDAEAHHNRGAALAGLARDEEALASYTRALELRPDRADTHLNRALVLLVTGRLREGWREFEWRQRLPEAYGVQSFAQPRWSGNEDIAGKTLLIHGEQGIGDTIQFSRYVTLLEARGAQVMLLVRPALRSLLANSYPSIRVIDEAPAAGFELHCPLLSLADAFGTELSSIPASGSYLVADSAKRRLWETRLGPQSKARIGIAWSGNPDHVNDRRRSIALEALAPLLSPAAEWFAIQNEVRERDTPTLRRHSEIRFFGTELKDFSDTAALLDLMDTVIAVDTGVAHLAAALGKTLWLLLPFASDWRWLRQRSDSPWYPTMRLFRQEVAGDWEGVIARVTSELASAL